MLWTVQINLPISHCFLFFIKHKNLVVQRFNIGCSSQLWRPSFLLFLPSSILLSADKDRFGSRVSRLTPISSRRLRFLYRMLLDNFDLMQNFEMRLYLCKYVFINPIWTGKIALTLWHPSTAAITIVVCLLTLENRKCPQEVSITE